MSIFFPGSQDRKKHRKISETAVLPTIPDEQHQEPPEPHKDAETESELEDDTVSHSKSFEKVKFLQNFFFSDIFFAINILASLFRNKRIMLDEMTQ